MTTLKKLERARASDLSVNQLTLTELQAEVGRRIKVLEKQRQELLAKLTTLESELEAVGALTERTVAGIVGLHNGDGGGGRMKAEDYARAVGLTLKPGKVYSTTELCDALVQAGFNAKKTTLSQGMATWLVEEGILEDKGKRGRANVYVLATAEAE